MSEVAAPPSQPATPPPPASGLPTSTESTAIDLDAFRKNGRKDTPPVEAKPAPEADETEDEDIAADPELAKEADEIEKPKPEETPQERNARRRKAKKAAQKARLTRLSNENQRLQTELAEARKAAPAPEPKAEPVPAGAKGAAFDKPKPTLKDFPLDQFKDDPDPYQAQAAALAEAVADWKIEEHKHGLAQERQRETAKAEATKLEAALDQSEAETRARHADYDAVVGAAHFPKTPASEYVRESIVHSGLFGPLRYYLSQPANRDQMLAILRSQRPQEVDWALGAVIATVKASLKEPEKPSAPKVNASDEPVQPVTAGAGSGAILRNPLKDAGTAIDLDEVRRFKQASGGR